MLVNSESAIAAFNQFVDKDCVFLGDEATLKKMVFAADSKVVQFTEACREFRNLSAAQVESVRLYLFPLLIALCNGEDIDMLIGDLDIVLSVFNDDARGEVTAGLLKIMETTVSEVKREGQLRKDRVIKMATNCVSFENFRHVLVSFMVACEHGRQTPRKEQSGLFCQTVAGCKSRLEEWKQKVYDAFSAPDVRARVDAVYLEKLGLLDAAEMQIYKIRFTSEGDTYRMGRKVMMLGFSPIETLELVVGHAASLLYAPVYLADSSVPLKDTDVFALTHEMGHAVASLTGVSPNDGVNLQPLGDFELTYNLFFSNTEPLFSRKYTNTSFAWTSMNEILQIAGIAVIDGKIVINNLSDLDLRVSIDRLIRWLHIAVIASAHSSSVGEALAPSEEALGALFYLHRLDYAKYKKEVLKKK
jgi:hypothetical protein